MTDQDQKQRDNTRWGIADQLRGAMNAICEVCMLTCIRSWS